MGFLNEWLAVKIKTENTETEKPNQLCYALGFLAMPMLFVLYIAFSIFKQIVRLYLLYSDDKFAGLLSGSDSVWGIEKKEWKSVVHVLYYAKSPKEIDLHAIARKRIEERIFNQSKDYQKLTGTCHQFMGYMYLRNNTYNIADCAKSVDISQNRKKFITEQDFKNFVHEYVHTAMPKNNCALWDVCISEKPILKEDTNGAREYIYPAIMRFNHMAADGASLVALTAKIFSDEVSFSSYLDKIFQQKNKKNSQTENVMSRAVKLGKRIIKIIYHYLRLFYVSIGTVLYVVFVKEDSPNGIHGPKLSGEHLLSWHSEDDVKFLPLVKKIKNMVPAASFSDVIFTALSCSVSDHLKRSSGYVPPAYSTLVPVVITLDGLQKPGPVSLENNFSFINFDLPSKRESLSKTLQCVTENSSYLKNNHDLVEVYYWIAKFVLGAFPITLLALVFNLNSVSLAISSLPGNAKGSIAGVAIEHVVFFTLNRWKCGVTASVITYDDRFHVGLFVDKAVLNSKEETEAITKDFFNNIKLLSEEVENKFNGQK